VAIKSSTHIYMHSSPLQNQTCLFLLHNYEKWSKSFPKSQGASKNSRGQTLLQSFNVLHASKNSLILLKVNSHAIMIPEVTT